MRTTCDTCRHGRGDTCLVGEYPSAYESQDDCPRWQPVIEDLILDLISERLELGRATYGPFRDDDPRDMRQEALEEAIDAAIYLARLCIRPEDHVGAVGTLRVICREMGAADSAEPHTDPLVDILRLGASAEVADVWMALGEWIAGHPGRPQTAQEARLIRAYHLAIGAHRETVMRLDEYLNPVTP